MMSQKKGINVKGGKNELFKKSILKVFYSNQNRHVGWNIKEWEEEDG